MQRYKWIALVGTVASVGAVGFVVPGGAGAPESSSVNEAAVAALPAMDAVAPDAAALEAAAAAEAEAAAAREPALETFTGSASYYADMFEGRTTASGVPFRQARLWAAHKTLPFGTRLRVTNLANGREVEVEVVDRGPYAHGRILDLSRTAANRLDFIRSGHTRVKIEVLERP